MFKRTCVLAVGVVCAALMAGCGPKKQSATEFTVLLRMMGPQERYFKEQVLPQFEKENNCKINLASFEDMWDIDRRLDLEKSKKHPDIGLVKVPFELTRDLVYKKYMLPLGNIVDSATLDADMAEYHQIASGLGYVDGKAFYIPRKLETRILFYRKSMVADAVAKYPSYQNKINTVLKPQNGYGLPAGYVLESDPALWDFYDLFVSGYIWANETYGDVKMGRIAHRGAKYEGTALTIIDRALQFGATSDDILKMSGDKIAAVFEWENAFVRNKIFNEGMWQDPWRGGNIYTGVKDGKVFLADFQQIDCFMVHGWSDDPGMPTYLPLEDDMGLAVMPQAVSFALDNNGAPTFTGTRAISTGGWWWGVPATSPNPKLAYKLARLITSFQMQANEISKFGMIPVRKDILNNLPGVFDQGWVGEIFKVSVDQMNINQINTVPLVKQYSKVGINYIDAWYALCVNYNATKDGPATLEKMKSKLESEFVPKEKEILGTSYPK